MPLQIPGFDKASKIVQERLILNVQGLEKCGKTHFAFTAPGPIACLSFDIGTEGVVGKFVDSKEILIREFKVPILNQQEAAVKVWTEFVTAFNQVMNHPQVKTVVVDTATDMWELVRLARLGKLTQVKPHWYTAVNAEVRSILEDAHSHSKNVILLHKMKEEYAGENKTGRWERAGFKEVAYIVQANLEASRSMASGQNVFKLKVVDCRQNMNLCGLELEGPMIDFEVFKQMVNS